MCLQNCKMAAPLSNMSILRRLRFYGNFCRISHIRMAQKRLMETKTEEAAETLYTTDTNGKKVGLHNRSFPKDWKMDPVEEARCIEEPLKYPKKHSGLMVLKTPKLPELVEQNARSILEDLQLINDTNFLKEVTHMNEVFKKRQPPTEHQHKKAKLEAIAAQLYQEETVGKGINPESLTEDQEKALQKKVNNRSWKIYAKTTHNHKQVQYKERTGLVYMAARLGANYRVLLQIFHELQKLDGDFKPSSVLNMGSGLGSAIWAGNLVWQEAVKEYYCVDTSSYMNDLARKLLCKNRNDPMSLSIPGVNFRQFLPSQKHESNRFPLTVSAYMLMEQPSLESRMELLENLWNLTDSYLVLVEHGTTAGYKLILEARQFLLQLGEEEESNQGHVFAPCGHDSPCPRVQIEKKPCTFFLKYKTLNLHTDFGQGTVPQDERYTYVVMKKGKREKQPGKQFVRLTDVKNRSSCVYCEMCLPDGTLRNYAVTKTKPSPHLLRCAKYCVAGDFLPVSLPDDMTPRKTKDHSPEQSENSQFEPEQRENS